MLTLRNRFIATLGLLAAWCFADPPMTSMLFRDMFQANQGEGQLAAKEFEQAVATYDELAGTTADPVIASLAKARAAVAVGLQESNYEQGLARARGVTDRAYGVQAQIALMFAADAFQEIVDAFGEEDIAAWPERKLPQLPQLGREAVGALALFDRGRAFFNLGDVQAAVRDLEQAQAFADTSRLRLSILTFLSRSVYARALDDLDRAFEADRRIAALRMGHMAAYLRHLLAAARYLHERERWDEALDVLGNVDWKRFPPASSWHHSVANATGQALAGAGRYADAAEIYRQIVENRACPIDRRAVAGLKAAEMLTLAGDPAGARQVVREVIALDGLKDDHRQQAEDALADLAQPD